MVKCSTLNDLIFLYMYNTQRLIEEKIKSMKI